MRHSLSALILAVIVATPCWAIAQANPSGATPGTDSGQTAAQLPPRGATLRILEPKSGQKLAQSFVSVRYELRNPGAAAGSPNFQVQLDGTDPIRTTSTEYNFTGVAPGAHTVIVELIDANNTPLARAQVQFTIVQPQPQPATRPPGAAGFRGSEAEMIASVHLRPAVLTTQEPQNSAPAISQEAEALPSASSALPLLSVIGFGVLLGGIASALKTR